MENLFKRLLEFTDTGIYRYTFNEGKIIMANRGFVKILNLDLKPEAIAGKHLKELLRYTEKEGTVRKALEESLDKKSPEKKEEPEEKSKPARNASNSDAGGNNNKKAIKPGETVKF